MNWKKRASRSCKGIGITLLLFVSFLNAQISVKGPQIGIGFSANTYIGDLNANETLHRFYPGLHLSLAFENQKLIAPAFHLFIGKFIAQTRNLPPVDNIQPNTFVKTHFINADLLIRIRPMYKKPVYPSIATGLGILNFTPKNENNQNYATLVTTRKPGESYASTTIALPLNLSINLKLARNIIAALNYYHLFPSTDYLDNIGQLGTKKGNDQLIMATLSVHIVFEAAGKLGR